jgi:hypothetical protein
MCPPGGTSVLSIATLAYIPDATNTVDSAFSRALHHQKETLIKIPTNATKDRYRKTRKSKVKNMCMRFTSSSSPMPLWSDSRTSRTRS